MSFKILLLAPDADPSWPEKIRRAVPGVVVNAYSDPQDALDDIADADAAYGTVPPELLARARKLRWICAARAGLGGAWFYDALVNSDVLVTNMRGSYNEHLAAHAVAFLLAFARRFDHYLPQKRWQRGPQMIDLPEQTVLIVGVGGAGGEASKLCAALAMRVLGIDPQATWDPVLAPSSWHGVTTILFGNCGVGFAPVRREHREGLIDLMEAIEDIPGTALAEGLKWEWESFPEYLDALDRMPRTIDIGAQIPHHPLKVFVMGDRGINREAATPDDIAEMRRLTEAALRAGAFGFTTSRTYSHKTNAGNLVPGHFAEEAELYGIGQAMAKVSSGAFGMNSDFVDEEAEFAWMTRLSKETGRPVWFLLTDRVKDPARWKRLMKGVHAARAQGAQITAQVAGRPVGIIMGIAGSYNPFSIRPSYLPLEALSPQERLRRMRDPELRRQLLSEEPSERQLARLSQARQNMVGRWDRMYVMAGHTPDYEPTPEKSIAAIAARGNSSPQEVAYDYLTEGLDRFLFFPIF